MLGRNTVIPFWSHIIRHAREVGNYSVTILSQSSYKKPVAENAGGTVVFIELSKSMNIRRRKLLQERGKTGQYCIDYE